MKAMSGWWLIPLIQAPWEADIGRYHIWVQGQPDLHSQFQVSQVYRYPVSEIKKNQQTKKQRERKKAHEKYVFTIRKNEISFQWVGYNQPKRQRIPWLFNLY